MSSYKMNTCICIADSQYVYTKQEFSYIMVHSSVLHATFVTIFTWVTHVTFLVTHVTRIYRLTNKSYIGL